MCATRFVAWESQLLAGPEGVNVGLLEITAWRRASVLNLPLDRQRPPVQTYRGASMPMDLGEQLSRRIRELSQATGVTPFMTLLTTLQVILMRYSGQDDILVGSPAAGRDRREFEALYGYFVNMMVLRVTCPETRPLRNCLGERVKRCSGHWNINSSLSNCWWSACNPNAIRVAHPSFRWPSSWIGSAIAQSAPAFFAEPTIRPARSGI